MTLTAKEVQEMRETAIEAREARFVELGRRGANADTKHPDRKEWEMLRDLLFTTTV